jgi:hypothetical protein
MLMVLATAFATRTVTRSWHDVEDRVLQCPSSPVEVVRNLMNITGDMRLDDRNLPQPALSAEAEPLNLHHSGFCTRPETVARDCSRPGSREAPRHHSAVLSTSKRSRSGLPLRV